MRNKAQSIQSNTILWNMQVYCINGNEQTNISGKENQKQKEIKYGDVFARNKLIYGRRSCFLHFVRANQVCFFRNYICIVWLGMAWQLTYSLSTPYPASVHSKTHTHTNKTYILVLCDEKNNVTGKLYVSHLSYLDVSFYKMNSTSTRR